MEARVRFVEGMQFVGTSASGHALALDSRGEGGANTAPSPMELVLIALGGCTGMDVVSILRKMRVGWERFEIALQAERAEEHPKPFTKIHLTYRIWGDGIPEDKLKRAIELSQERYCSVGAMLAKGAEITYGYEINPEPRPGTQ
ncbi:MAG: OsmC family protein [Candidatus Acetothermia bacterium]|jgi:putative redox protein|nr:OsmC family protein [Candidatus Acetothermia bacterium]MDH7506131.1 OsmC family protein [Candidatus Acetothermia bacterium]